MQMRFPGDTPRLREFVFRCERRVSRSAGRSFARDPFAGSVGEKIRREIIRARLKFAICLPILRVLVLN